MHIYILNNGKDKTKFQVLRVSRKLLYNLQLDNYYLITVYVNIYIYIYMCVCVCV